MGTEKLKFKLELYATMWDKPPHAEIMLDDKSFFNGDITGTEDKPNVIEFEHEFTEGEKGELIIKRSGKNKGQTVINKNGDVLKDQLLHIKNIEIDWSPLRDVTGVGVYTPDYPEPWATQQRQAGVELPESFKNVTSIGHNGIWEFKFTSPFYMWLLENLY